MDYLVKKIKNLGIMKKILLWVLVLFSSFNFYSQNALVTWNGRLVNNFPSFEPTFLINSSDGGLTSNSLNAEDISSVGVGGISIVSYESFYGSGWTTSTTMNSGQYFELQVSPKENNILNINRLVLTYKGNCKRMRIRYSKNANFSNSTTVYSSTSLNVYNTPTLVDVDFPSEVSITDSETLYIRIYGYGNTGSASNSSSRYWSLQFNANNPSSNLGPTLYGTVGCQPQGLPETNGSDSWIGYVYNWNGSSATNYLGFVTESAIFDRNIGSGNVNGATATLCSTPNDNFFVRYRMRKTFPAGQYTFTVGADDGYRLSINGSDWIGGLSDWGDHSYQEKTMNICLDGSTNFILEYYERGGDSRIKFNYTATTTNPPTSLTGTNAICQGSATTLTANGVVGPFEWGTGTVGQNIISGQTGASISVSPATTTTYWVRVKQTSPCVTYSTGLTRQVTVTANATAPTYITGNNSNCPDSAVTLTAVGGTGNNYQWGTGTVVGSNIISGTAASIVVYPSVTTSYWVRRTNSAPCSTTTTGVVKEITVAIPGNPAIFGDNVWNVYGYNEGGNSNPTKYRGYYVQDLGNNVGFDTKAKWGDLTSPSSASDWMGCSVNVDAFTVVHKRKGFPCGRYKLEFLYYDDDTVVTVTDANGTIWTQNYPGYFDGNGGATIPINGNNTFALDSKSTVEVRTTDGSGPSKVGIKFSSVSDAIYLNGAWNKDPSYMAVQIQSDFALNNDLVVCSCKVEASKTLTINPDISLKVIGNITVNSSGQIIIENNGSLVQVDDAATYTGSPTSFTAKRITQPLRRYDYTYWSSPVREQDWSLNDLSPSTLADKYMSYDPASSWIIHYGGLEQMETGRGYSVRAPQYFDIDDQVPFSTQFNGIPNNGVINYQMGGAETSNLVGNPYPCALSADDFITANEDSILGTLYFWTHNTAVSGYVYTSGDYATYNLTGGAASQSQGVGGVVPSGKIALGQSFFVERKNNANNTLVFRNSMRVMGGNNQFFKTTPTEVDQNVKNRFWLNISNENNAYSEVLVGYMQGATNDFDANYDGKSFGGNVISIYSLLNETPLVIQGRALPFDNTDVIPLGYTATAGGTFTISLNRFEGLFGSQEVFLRDKTNNSITNLKEMNYMFTTTSGTFNTRFEIIFLNPEDTLSTQNPVLDDHSIVVFNTDNQISVKSSEAMIKKVIVYDLLGRVLFAQKDINSKEFVAQNISAAHQIVLVKVTTESNNEVSRKVIIH